MENTVLPNRFKQRTPKQQQLIDDRQRATLDIERRIRMRPQQRDVMALVKMRRANNSEKEQNKFIDSLKEKYPPPRIRTNTRKTFKSLIPRPKKHLSEPIDATSPESVIPNSAKKSAPEVKNTSIESSLDNSANEDNEVMEHRNIPEDVQEEPVQEENSPEDVQEEPVPVYRKKTNQNKIAVNAVNAVNAVKTVNTVKTVPRLNSVERRNYDPFTMD